MGVRLRRRAIYGLSHIPVAAMAIEHCRCNVGGRVGCGLVRLSAVEGRNRAARHCHPFCRRYWRRAIEHCLPHPSFALHI